LCKAKFGEDLDSVEKDGITWVVSSGSPPRHSKLEDSLAEVKTLYKRKFGKDVDSDSEDSTVEKDGIIWAVTRGSPPSCAQVEDRLAEVKTSYKAKFGEDVDL